MSIAKTGQRAKTKTSDLDTWREDALEVESDALPASNVPLHVLFGEAIDVAKFHAKYWDNRVEKKKIVRYGLASAVPRRPAKDGPAPRLTAETGAEIESLQRAAAEAHTLYLLAAGGPGAGDDTDRALFLLNEMTATFEFFIDDGVQDAKDEQYASVSAEHADDPQTADALAGALDDYASLLNPYRADLDGLGGFDVTHIDEAREVAARLRKRDASPVVMSDKARAAIALRNKVVTLLYTRMSNVRAGARFVFRDDSAIVRQATSAYERRRRGAARRAKAKKPIEPKKNDT